MMRGRSNTGGYPTLRSVYAKKSATGAPIRALLKRQNLFEAYIPVSVSDFIREKCITEGKFEVPCMQDENETIIMFADVAGFTKLTDKMSRLGTPGLEKHVYNLNSLFALILERVRQNGGDVLKFAGDAIEIYWPNIEGTEKVPFAERVSRVVLMCLDLQRELAEKFSNVDLSPFGEASKGDVQELSVKFGIGCGRLRILHLGGAVNQHTGKSCIEFTPVGPGIWDAHACERHAVAKQVVISSSVYQHVKDVFECEQLGSSSHYRVLPTSSTKNLRAKYGSKSVRRGKPLQLTLKKHSSLDAQVMKVAKALRDVYERYLPPTIVQYVNGRAENWLPEFRTVTTIFFSVKLAGTAFTDGSDGSASGLETLQRLFKAVQEIVFEYEGDINKIFFDKSSFNILVLFGVSPFGQDDSAKRGLLCAISVLTALQKEGKMDSDILSSAAGVTTGRAFCGVLGSTDAIESDPTGINSFHMKKFSGVGMRGSSHIAMRSGSHIAIDRELRVFRLQKEYSVIGDDVNLASRLMGKAEEENKLLYYDERTREATRDFISSTKLSKKVKGKEKNVIVYEVVDFSTSYQERKQNQLALKARWKMVFSKASAQNIFSIKAPSYLRGARKQSVALKNAAHQTSSRLSRGSAVKNDYTRVDNLRRPPTKLVRANNRTNKRKSSFGFGRRRGSVHIAHVAQRTMVSIKKNIDTKRRATFKFSKSGNRYREGIETPREETDMELVLKNLEDIREGFINRMRKVGDKKENKRHSLGGDPISKLKNMSKAKNSRRKFSTRASADALTSTRLVRLQGTAGCGKSHTVAQVFLSASVLDVAEVVVATGNPFQSDAFEHGVSVWLYMIDELINRRLSQLLKVQSQDDLKSMPVYGAEYECLIDKAYRSGKNLFWSRANSGSKMKLTRKEKDAAINKPHSIAYKLVKDYILAMNQTRDDIDSLDELKNIMERIDSTVSSDTIESLRSQNRISPELSYLREFANCFAAVVCGLAHCHRSLTDKKGGTIFVVDDAHALNYLSFYVLQQILDYYPETPLLVVICVRKDSFEPIMSDEVDTDDEEIDNVEEEDRRVAEMEVVPVEDTTYNSSEAVSQSRERFLEYLFQIHMYTPDANVLITLVPNEAHVSAIIKHNLEMPIESHVPQNLVGFIQRKSRGHPRYVVDAIQMYKSQGLLETKGDNLVGTKEFDHLLENNALDVPLSVETTCSMMIDKMSIAQQLALKIAVLLESQFNLVMIKDACPVKELKGEMEKAWAGLTKSDIFQPIVVIKDDADAPPDDKMLFNFRAEWIKESVENRMLYQQKQRLKALIAKRQRRWPRDL